MKVVVTGAAGFIGSAIVRSMLRQFPDSSIVAVDAVSDYYDVRLKRANLASLKSDRVKIIEADLWSMDLTGLVEDADAVLHQAGQPGVRPSWGSSFATYTRHNVEVTQRLLEALRTTGSRARLIYASSSSVYGNAKSFPVSELDATAPMSPYGVTKLAAEHLCRLYSANFGVPTVSLRYFTVYGPGQRPDMAFHKFCKAALLGHPLEIFGDGTQIRDFTFIDDVVNANLAAMTSTADIDGGFYNICGGGSISVNDTLDLIEDYIGKPLSVSRGPAVPGDVFRTGGSNEAAVKDLSWKPVVDVPAGLLRECDWARSLYSPGA